MLSKLKLCRLEIEKLDSTIFSSTKVLLPQFNRSTKILFDAGMKEEVKSFQVKVK